MDVEIIIDIILFIILRLFYLFALNMIWLMRRFTEDIFANPISWLLDPFFQ